jgi:Smg protein
MYEVLMYLFQHYRTPQSFPETDDLHDKLTTVGFDEESVDLALDWLIGLASATQNIRLVSHANPGTVRIYAPQELDQLGVEAIRFITFLENAGALYAPHRELIIERALAVKETPISLSKLRILCLMVLWSQEVEFDALVFDELLSYDQDSVRLPN